MCVNKFHPNEKNNDVPMDGEVSGSVRRRSAIKLSDGPKITVAIPIGPKRMDFVLECPECKKRGAKHSQYKVSEGFNPEALVSVNFMLQHMNWQPPLNVSVGYLFKTGMLSAAARQIMTQEAKRLKTPEYIFYVDDDMIIPPLGLFTLYNFMERNPDAGAVSGVYTTRQEPCEPFVYTEHGKGASWDFELGPGAEPKQIMGSGAGCLLARVEAIVDWESENPDTPIWCDSVENPASNGEKIVWGHDIRFIRNLTEAGWPCYVNGQVLCGHYDIRSGKIFEVPKDAPGFKKRAVNTEEYWDGIYIGEGFNTWRTYEKMFTAVEDLVLSVKANSVGEVGCGSGVLGQRLTAKIALRWAGVDMSEVAVAQARARFLNASCADARDLSSKDISEMTCGDTLVATEFLEHLSWDDAKNFLEKVQEAGVKNLIFATPYNCMPPEEVPEHEVFVNDEYKDKVCGVLSDFDLNTFKVVDEQGHALWVFNRKVPRSRKAK
ncbi:MAG: hypothetical protein DRI57_23815 [Deltaproteobacteria bacterium]|nr:MAG: hypothetical protein DRI57_23815 [Deltaproteobacteria bacterium]